jgi:Ser/Thr protein kinase RdoA (MazF antagonist)
MNLIRHILDKYDIRGATIHPVQKGYRNQSWHVTLNDGREVNVIIYKAEPHILTKIKNANAVSAFLAHKGFPVRHTIDDRIVRLQGETMTKYAALYNYLPGSTIPWEAYTQKHIKMLGKMLSDMHALLAAAKPPKSPLTGGLEMRLVTAEYRAIITRMERYFSDPAVANSMVHKLGVQMQPRTMPKLQQLLDVVERLPDQQPLHVDFVRGNVLFGGSGDTLAISGILDFEKTAIGSPIVDIARTLAFLLIDCKYKSEEKVRKCFLYSGYHKRGAARVPHTELLEPLVDLFLAYDFYKFLRHNPYESLGENEHFVRTREILLRRKILANK